MIRISDLGQGIDRKQIKKLSLTETDWKPIDHFRSTDSNQTSPSRSSWKPTQLSLYTQRTIMASVHFSSSSLPCLATILLWALCGISWAVPCTTPSSGAQSQAIVRREADMTPSQIQSVVQVKLGLSVMQRFIVSLQINQRWHYLAYKLKLDIIT